MLVRVAVTADITQELQFYDNLLSLLTPWDWPHMVIWSCVSTEHYCDALLGSWTRSPGRCNVMSKKSHQTSPQVNEQIMKANDLCQPINALKEE